MPSNPMLLIWVELRTERRLEFLHLSLRWAGTGHGLGGWTAPWEEVMPTLEIPYPAAAEGSGSEAGDGFLKPPGLQVIECQGDWVC